MLSISQSTFFQTKRRSSTNRPKFYLISLLIVTLPILVSLYIPFTSQSTLGGMPLGKPLQLLQNEKQKAVVEAFQHGWKAYKEYAWGKDELKPISRKSNEWLKLGLTLVDSLDTMWLMGLSDEFDEARKWVEHEMVIAVDNDVNLFETR